MMGKRRVFTLLIFNLNLAMGSGIMYSLLTSLFPVGGAELSIPDPVPILRANLTSNSCGPEVVSCPQTKYRSMNGSCNNLKHPSWGTANSTYLRLLKNRYADGIFEMPKTVSGGSMPNARELSIEFFKDKITYDLQVNLNFMQWGQMGITHDMSFLATPTGEVGQSVTCCGNGQLTPEARTNPFCAPVEVPANDRIHKPGSCLEFVRADTDQHVGCATGSKEANQLTTVTPFIDASIVYGNTDELTAQLRTFVNGTLKTVRRNGREWPPQVKNVTKTCTGAESPKEPCYFGGDTRINQNTELTVLQVLMLLYHNSVARGLVAVNPGWTDEQVFQEARRIVIAVCQNINYYEYLPHLLGREHMLANKLIYNLTKDNMGEYVNDYDETLAPGVLSEHANAALRLFHSLIQGYLEKRFNNRVYAGRIRLSDWYNRPLILEQGNTFKQLVVGFTAQPSSLADTFYSVEITKYLFRGKNKYGGDLRAVDIQRGRDMGLGSYVAARAACNLTVPRTFRDLQGTIPNHFIRLLRKYYGDVRNIDLTVGGSLERHAPGARAGPTFLCLLLAQFFRTRVSDRYWYENGANTQIAFKPKQLATVRGMTMAGIFCDTGAVDTMQRRAFEIIKADNPVVSCDDIPTVDLTLWKDDDGEKDSTSQSS